MFSSSTLLHTVNQSPFTARKCIIRFLPQYLGILALFKCSLMHQRFDKNLATGSPGFGTLVNSRLLGP